MLARTLCATTAVILMLTATAAWADDPATVIVVNSTPTAPVQAQGDAATQGEYWLGLIASRPSPALQAQLKLPKDQGIVVEAVQPESPARKAGVQPYDILLTGNEKPLSGLHDLFLLINQVKDGKLKLDLLRVGKHVSVTVTPAKRPAHEMGTFGLGMLEIREGAPASGVIQGSDSNLPEKGTLEFRVVRPGQILPAAGPSSTAAASVDGMIQFKSELSDGSKVEIDRRGQEPAKFTVTHGKDKWQGTAKDLSKIPEKIRSEVEKLLHTAIEHNVVFAGSSEAMQGPMTFFATATAAPGLPGSFAVSPEVERRLSEMQKQIDELRHTVDVLKRNATKSAAKPE